jgi:hypothetical protein
MSLTTVTELRSALGVGTLYPDSTLQEVCDATDAVLVPMLWNNSQWVIAHGNTGTVGTLYFNVPIANIFYVGQSVTIANCGTKYNGTKTITAVGTYSFNVTTTHTSDTPRHPIEPFGSATGESYIDWTTDTAVQQAALQIAVDIWQARQTSSSGGVAVDFQPGPWKMSSSLLARVRGLIAHALDPRSMVG